MRKRGEDRGVMRTVFVLTEGRGESMTKRENPKTFAAAVGPGISISRYVASRGLRHDIYSADRARVSKFPPANTATSNNSGRVRAGTMRFSTRWLTLTDTRETSKWNK